MKNKQFNNNKSTIPLLMTIIHEKSSYIKAHSTRVAYLSLKIGRSINLPSDQLCDLRLTAMLHDIGKVFIDDVIHNKPGSLTESEYDEMKKHPEIGCRIVVASTGTEHIADYILCHHERWDGNGYPQGLKSESIPLLSRIISIADAYEAMTNNRVYREAKTKEQAISDIIRNSGKQFDPMLVKEFLAVINET